MNFDWEGYLQHAKDLKAMVDAGSRRKDILLRNCVSRAYYAAFHRAYIFLLEVKSEPVVCWDHYQRIKKFPSLVGLANKLKAAATATISESIVIQKHKEFRISKHKGVRELFDSASLAEGSIYSGLLRMRDKRSTADYDSIPVITKSDAITAIADADLLIAELDHLTPTKA